LRRIGLRVWLSRIGLRGHLLRVWLRGHLLGVWLRRIGLGTTVGDRVEEDTAEGEAFVEGEAFAEGSLVVAPAEGIPVVVPAEVLVEEQYQSVEIEPCIADKALVHPLH